MFSALLILPILSLLVLLGVEKHLCGLLLPLGKRSKTSRSGWAPGHWVSLGIPWICFTFCHWTAFYHWVEGRRLGDIGLDLPLLLGGGPGAVRSGSPSAAGEGQGNTGPLTPPAQAAQGPCVTTWCGAGDGLVPWFCCSHSCRPMSLLLLTYVKPVFWPFSVLLSVYLAHCYLAGRGHGED